jgi:hypothetical protein
MHYTDQTESQQLKAVATKPLRFDSETNFYATYGDGGCDVTGVLVFCKIL